MLDINLSIKSVLTLIGGKVFYSLEYRLIQVYVYSEVG